LWKNFPCSKMLSNTKEKILQSFTCRVIMPKERGVPKVSNHLMQSRGAGTHPLWGHNQVHKIKINLIFILILFTWYSASIQRLLTEYHKEIKKHEAIQKMEWLWDLMFCKHTSKYTKKNLGGFCIVKKSTLQGEAPRWWHTPNRSLGWGSRGSR
jgi:hypothetical protein